MNFAIFFGLLLSTTMATAQKKKPGGEMNIRADEAATEPKEADEPPRSPLIDERIVGEFNLTKRFFVVRRGYLRQKGIYLYSWTDARDACKAFGADLAMVHSKEEAELLIKHLLANFRGTDEFFLGAKKEGNQMKWITGGPLSCAEPFQNVCSPGSSDIALKAVSEYNLEKKKFEISFSKSGHWGQPLCAYYV